MAIAPLIEIMDRLHECHAALLELAKQKTSVLVHNQVDELNQILQKESKWVRDITALDQQRVHAIGEYLIQRGYTPNANVTISDLIRIIFKAEEKQELANAHTRLLAVIDELQDVHRLNQELIQQSIAFIEYSMDVMFTQPEDDIVYGNPAGQKQANMRAGVFDTKA